MRRIFAVFCVGFGLALVGVALGLLYIDFRSERALTIALEAGVAEPVPSSSGLGRGMPIEGSEHAKAAQAIQQWADPAPIWLALVSGSLGAALFGSGCLIAMFELPVFRPKS